MARQDPKALPEVSFRARRVLAHPSAFTTSLETPTCMEYDSNTREAEPVKAVMYLASRTQFLPKQCPVDRLNARLIPQVRAD
jgi:hypothetical protein